LKLLKDWSKEILSPGFIEKEDVALSVKEKQKEWSKYLRD